MTFWGPKDLVRSISLDPMPAIRTACPVGQGQPHSIAVVDLGGHSLVLAFLVYWHSHCNWYTLANKVPSSQMNLAYFNLTEKENI